MEGRGDYQSDLRRILACIHQALQSDSSTWLIPRRDSLQLRRTCRPVDLDHRSRWRRWSLPSKALLKKFVRLHCVCIQIDSLLPDQDVYSLILEFFYTRYLHRQNINLIRHIATACFVYLERASKFTACPLFGLSYMELMMRYCTLSRSHPSFRALVFLVCRSPISQSSTPRAELNC